MAGKDFVRASENFKFQNVRICFVNLAVPKQFKQKDGSKSDPKYSVRILLDKDNQADVDQIDKFAELLDSLARKSWGPRGATYLEKGALWNPLRDGDDDPDVKDGFENTKFVGAGTKPRGYNKDSNTNYADLSKFSVYPGPTVGYINPEKTGIVKVGDTEFDFNEVYAGCYASVSVTVQTYKHDSGGKGITCFLRAILKTDDGDRLDGAAPAKLDDEFADELTGLNLNSNKPIPSAEELDIEDLDRAPRG